MTPEEIQKLNEKLVEILSKEKGYFGSFYTWGQRDEDYEFIGYELSEDFLPQLKSLTDDQRKKLIKIMTYFEIHVNPLKKMLDGNVRKGLYDFYAELAWSHFMTIVMFGMLEVAVKDTPCALYKRTTTFLDKRKSILLFLETYLPTNIKDDVAKRYKTEDGTVISSFEDVVNHMWEEIRSGFIHEAGVYHKGTEWGTLRGLGSEADPIHYIADVPMQELMQLTWQAILNSLGYKGVLILPGYKK